MNPCPNCASTDVWDDNAHWGCNKCGWCSLAGLNTTRTPSAPFTLEPDPTEIRKRAADWARIDAGLALPPTPARAEPHQYED